MRPRVPITIIWAFSRLATSMIRPGGKPAAEFSLGQLRQAVETALGSPVAFCEDTVGENAEAAIAALPATPKAILGLRDLIRIPAERYFAVPNPAPPVQIGRV